jgi:hypothetical protein
MIVTTHANNQDTVDEVKNEVEEKSITFLKFIGSIFNKPWITNSIDWLSKNKGLFILLLLGVIAAGYVWITKVDPALTNLNQLNSKMVVFEKQKQKTDSLLLLNQKILLDIHSNMVSGFKDINYRFDNIDNDFGNLIHYVSKSKYDENWLINQILNDHKNIEKPPYIKKPE